MKAEKADRRTIETALEGFDPSTRLILIYGPDDAQVHEIADRFTARLLPPDDPLGRVDLDKATLQSDPARLADEAASIPMFGGTRLIRVDGAGEECAAAVEMLLTAGAAGNPVIMTAGALKPTAKLLKPVIAAPCARAFQCYPPDARDAERMIADACARHGLRPSREALTLLVMNFAAERGVLARELEKLALYLGAEPGTETGLDVEALAAIGTAMSDADFGGLVNAVARGNIAEAERQSAKLEQNGIAGIGQLRAVARRFWVLAEVRAGIDAGRSPREAVEATRPPIFWKEKEQVVAQASAWPTLTLRRALAHLLETERRIKTSGSAPPQLLAVHALAAIARAAAARRKPVGRHT